MTTNIEMKDTLAPDSVTMSDDLDHSYLHQTIIGSIPYLKPNVRPGQESKDILGYIEKTNLSRHSNTPSWVKGCIAGCCCATGFGCCYLYAVQTLVKNGEYGFSLNNGVPEMLMPGRHLLLSPLNSLLGVRSSGDDVIQMGPITVIRVPMGSLGFAMNNALAEVLLPGVHVRNSAAFRFDCFKPLGQELIEFGPIKFLTVNSGQVRVCYDKGKVCIFAEGRYAFNSGTFRVAGAIDTTQRNVRFAKHPVLLTGGINMLVEGLLTYQVTDVAKLIHQLGEQDLLRAIQDITKAELARVFANIHLEQLAAGSSNGLGESTGEERKEPAFLGASHDDEEGQVRSKICADVMRYIAPFSESWGVRIINFQLEATFLADPKFAQEYEEATLAFAKAKSKQRAINAENAIRLNTSAANAKSYQIEAEGRAAAVVLEARGQAEARKIEANARNEAAKSMTDEFARQFALAGQQVDFAKNLQARVLTVTNDSAVGRQMTNNYGWAPNPAVTGLSADLLGPVPVPVPASSIPVVPASSFAVPAASIPVPSSPSAYRKPPPPPITQQQQLNNNNHFAN